MTLAIVAYTHAFRASIFVLAILHILTAPICLLTFRDKPSALSAIDV